MSECIHCGATDDEEHGVVVGTLGELNETVCNICRADDLAENTTLSEREAEVAAHKQITGASHETIADRLGIEKSTVDTNSTRFQEKVRAAKVTENELCEFL